MEKMDLISRKASIDALKQLQKNISADYSELDPLVMAGCGYIGDCIGELECLPSAQRDVPDTNVVDMIDRKAAIDVLNIANLHPGIVSAMQSLIADLPSAPKQKWIPVSEMLPEYGVAVLTYDGYCFCVEKRIPTIKDDEGEPITGDWWVSDDYNEYESDYYPNLRDGACIAWMPLPEPYTEEQPELKEDE